jgi:hypothetical protein
MGDLLLSDVERDFPGAYQAALDRHLEDALATIAFMRDRFDIVTDEDMTKAIELLDVFPKRR